MKRPDRRALSLFADPSIVPIPPDPPKPAQKHGSRRGRGKLPRSRRAGMNRLERDYADHLEELMRNGEVLWWRFEPVSLNLQDPAEEPEAEQDQDDEPEPADPDGKPKARARQRGRYTPDFLVQMVDGLLEVHEVKGGYFDPAAKVRLKWAAQRFPIFRFVVVTRERKSSPWKYEEFSA